MAPLVFARNDGRFSLAAFDQCLPAFDAKVALGSSATVAFDATRLEDGLDFLHEINLAARWRWQRFRLLRRDFGQDRKSTRLNSSHSQISYAVFCLKKKQRLLLLQLPEPSAHVAELQIKCESCVAGALI